MSDLHHEITLPATPDRVYAALMQSDLHAAFTDAPATIGAAAGDRFSAYGGKVHGVNIDLAPGRRIVQAWRAANWPEGIFSLIRFELEPDEKGTRVQFHQGAIPDGMAEHLEGGWKSMYWAPLEAFLS